MRAFSGRHEEFWPGDLVEVCYASSAPTANGDQRRNAASDAWDAWQGQTVLGCVQTKAVQGLCHVLLSTTAWDGEEAPTLEDRPPLYHRCRGEADCPFKIQYHGFKGYGVGSGMDIDQMLILLDDRTWEGGEGQGRDGDGFRRNGFDVNAWEDDPTGGGAADLGIMRTCSGCHDALRASKLPPLSILQLQQHRVPVAFCSRDGTAALYRTCASKACSCRVSSGGSGDEADLQPEGRGPRWIEAHVRLLPEINEASKEALALCRSRTRVVRNIPSSQRDRTRAAHGVDACDAARAKLSRPTCNHTPGDPQGGLQRTMLKHTIQFPQHLSELFRLLDTKGVDLPGPSSFATQLGLTKVVSISPRDSEEELNKAIDASKEFILDVVGGRGLMRNLVLYNHFYAKYDEHVLGNEPGTPLKSLGYTVVLGREHEKAAKEGESRIRGAMAGPAEHRGSAGQHTRSGIMQTGDCVASYDERLQSAAIRFQATLRTETGHGGSSQQREEEKQEQEEKQDADSEAEEMKGSIDGRYAEEKIVMVHAMCPAGDFNRHSEALVATHPFHFINGREMTFDPKRVYNGYSNLDWSRHTYGNSANRSRAQDAMLLDHQNMDMRNDLLKQSNFVFKERDCSAQCVDSKSVNSVVLRGIVERLANGETWNQIVKEMPQLGYLLNAVSTVCGRVPGTVHDRKKSRIVPRAIASKQGCPNFW